MIKHASSRPLIGWFVLVSLFLFAGGCASRSPTKRVPSDTELTRTMSAARTAFSRGSINEATTLYRRALSQARAIDNPSAIADAAYNLSACYTRKGRYGKAIDLLEEAKAETLRSQGNLTDVLLAQATVARWQGDSEQALLFANQVISHEASDPQNSHKLQVYVLRGHIACDKGDVGLALSELKTAIRYGDVVSDPVLKAGLSGLTGRITLLNQEPMKAAQAFDREVAFIKLSNQRQGMVQALKKAAEAYLSAGNNQLAADRFFRGARSAFAQNDLAGAIKLGEMALLTAEKAADPQAISRTRTLLDEIEDAVASPH